MLWNTLLLSLRAIRRNLMRSFLTILGIVIGIAAVITLVTLGNGATRSVSDQIAAMRTQITSARAVANDDYFLAGAWDLSSGRNFSDTEERAIEAVVLSGLGGLIGIALATGASVGLARLMGVPYMFDPGINLVSFLFSAAIGVVFGFFPARRAAGLDPIDALRYE